MDTLEVSTRGDSASVRDPVCGTRVHSSSAAATEEYAGETYYFCSHACHERFNANPELYASRPTGPN
ncbi:MAG: YHS domain-containing protein [Dehalococcoidia bacterium]|nr:YHS domain-containing protein [Dehalococcoidia bacterium]